MTINDSDGLGSLRVDQGARFFIIVSAVLIMGCGQKGALYLPEDEASSLVISADANAQASSDISPEAIKQILADPNEY